MATARIADGENVQSFSIPKGSSLMQQADAMIGLHGLWNDVLSYEWCRHVNGDSVRVLISLDAMKRHFPEIARVATPGGDNCIQWLVPNGPVTWVAVEWFKQQ